MNSSAKFTFMFLGASALGGVAFACTVTSSPVDDTDGGTNTNSSSSSSTSSSSSSGAVTADDVCPSLADASVTIDSVDCNLCLAQNCCQQTAACWDIPNDGGTDNIGCDEYRDQLEQCDESPTGTPADCKTALNGGSGQTPALYAAYDQCRATSCQTQCAGFNDPDAGTLSH